MDPQADEADTSGKIVEHEDVIHQVPETALRANGMF